MQACINGATTQPYGLEEDLEAAAAAGFPLVAIWSGKLGPYFEKHSVADLRQTLADRGLGVAAICPYSLRLFGDGDAGLEPIRRAAARAAEIGCPQLLVCPDAPHGEEAGDDAYRVAGTRARAYGDVAAAAGIRLAIEPLGRHPFVPGPRQAGAILQAADHPALGLMMDTFHYHKSGVPESEISAVPAGWWTIVHINDVPAGDPAGFSDGDRLYPGEGVLPLARTLQHFASLGFSQYRLVWRCRAAAAKGHRSVGGLPRGSAARPLDR